MYLAASAAHAKAEIAWYYVDNLEMVITHVDVGWSDGDTDLNLVMRPLLPAKEKSAFPNVKNKASYPESHWRPDDPRLRDTWGAWAACYSQKGLQDTVSSKNVYSQACKSCAGDGPDGTACVIDSEKVYDAHPCPKLFGCITCVNDLVGIYHTPKEYDCQRGYDLSFFLPKAELFIAQPGCDKSKEWNGAFQVECNDAWPNAPFQSMLGKLGVICPTCSMEMTFNGSDIEQQVCTEEFDDAGNPIAKPTELCGKPVLTSGVVMFDDAHWDRPEVHPISKMTVKWGENDYRVLALVDGSTKDGSSGWDADYHEQFKDKPGMFPSSMTFKLKDLEAPQPAGLQVSSCSVTTDMLVNSDPSFNPAPLMSSEHCPTLDVKLDGKIPTGAAWSAHVKTEWRNPKVQLGLSSKLKQLHGVVSSGVPKQVTNVPCVLPPAPAKGALKLSHYWRYDLDFAMKLDGIAPDALNWFWTVKGNGVVFTTPLKGLHPTNGTKLGVWFPLGGYHDGLSVGTALVGKAFLEGEFVGQVQTTIERPPANVAIVTSPPKLQPSGKYSFMLSASPNFFCGKTADMVFEWKRTNNGQKAWAPSGPKGVVSDLAVTGVQSVEVTAHDVRNVEYGYDALVIEPPRLAATIQTRCASRPASVPAPPPPGMSWNQSVPRIARCAEVELTAKVAETKGTGAKFEPLGLHDLTFAWSVKVGRGTVVTKHGNRVVISASPGAEFDYDVALAVTDKWKRSATAIATASNDHSGPELAAKRLDSIWTLFNNVPQPLPSPCMVGCPEQTSDDPLVRNFAIMRYQALHASPSAFARSRGEIERFASYFVGKKRGVSTPVPKRSLRGLGGAFAAAPASARPSRSQMFKAARAKLRLLSP
jgi:hypothetical protein